ncbi:YqjF family protein [Robertkochia solimangrovi]|uniref:YqjF family protein n=1 Tax=Robertkochia solimangrovi TaxID=2213046 RepID=UPI00117D999A|nr:DUF2071 domain-containing protein [Robertkochia solimangrovi]TRZ41620.1 DUF2071 domain-containing protein [Robertkochia solimangrovi]
MTIKNLLKKTDHRPWKLPDHDWKFYQEWNNAIFLHWQVEISALKKFVPNDLEIDLFEGKPWVSIVAFSMENIRPKNLPAFSPISNFDEINIRTYVKANGKTGVYFLSIEGGKKLSCKVAKGISELPYRYSRMQRTPYTYLSSNPEYKDQLKINHDTGMATSNKSDLDKWLTERYALFQDTEKYINEFEIHHIEWPLQQIQISKLELHYPRFNDLLSQKPDKTHFSKGVRVLAWNKTPLR